MAAPASSQRITTISTIITHQDLSARIQREKAFLTEEEQQIDASKKTKRLAEIQRDKKTLDDLQQEAKTIDTLLNKTILSSADKIYFYHQLSKTNLYEINIKREINNLEQQRTKITNDIAALTLYEKENIKSVIKKSTSSVNDLEYSYLKMTRLFNDSNTELSSAKIIDIIQTTENNSKLYRQTFINNILTFIKPTDKLTVETMLQQTPLIRLELLHAQIKKENRHNISRINLIKKLTQIAYTKEIQAKSVGIKEKFNVNTFISKQFNIGENQLPTKYPHFSHSVPGIKKKFEALLKSELGNDAFNKAMNAAEQDKLLTNLINTGAFDNAQQCINFIEKLLSADEAYEAHCNEYFSQQEKYVQHEVTPPTYLDGTPHLYRPTPPLPWKREDSKNHGDAVLTNNQRLILTKIKLNIIKLDNDLRDNNSITANEFLYADPIINASMLKWRETAKITRASKTDAIQEITASSLDNAYIAKKSYDSLRQALELDRTLRQQQASAITLIIRNTALQASAVFFGPVVNTVYLLFETAANRIMAIAANTVLPIFPNLQKEDIDENSAGQINRGFQKSLQHHDDQYSGQFEERQLQKMIAEERDNIFKQQQDIHMIRDELRQLVITKMNARIQQEKLAYDDRLKEFKRAAHEISQHSHSQAILHEVGSIAMNMTNMQLFIAKKITTNPNFSLKSTDDFCNNFPDMWKNATGRWGNDTLMTAIENSTWLGGDQNEKLRHSLGFIKKTVIKTSSFSEIISTGIRRGIDSLREISQSLGISKTSYIQHQRLLTAFAADIILFSLNKNCGTALVVSTVEPSKQAATLLDIFIMTMRLPQFGSPINPQDNIVFRLMETIPDMKNILQDANVLRELIKLRFSPDYQPSLKKLSPDALAHLDILLWKKVPGILIGPAIEAAKNKINDAKPASFDKQAAAIATMLNIIIEIQQLPKHYQDTHTKEIKNAISNCLRAIPKKWVSDKNILNLLSQEDKFLPLIEIMQSHLLSATPAPTNNTPIPAMKETPSPIKSNVNTFFNSPTTIPKIITTIKKASIQAKAKKMDPKN